MKKLVFTVLIFFCSISLFAQTGERVEIQGTIEMPPGDDQQGISIFNLNSNRGTVTNNDGQFEIEVKVDDSLSVSSVQFQEFIIIIDKGVIDSRQLNISVTEVVNLLPEVIVSPYDLTGNVRVDIARIRVVEVPDTLTALDVANTYTPADAEPDLQESPENIALRQSQNFLVNGFNFVNLFREMVVTRKGTDEKNEKKRLNADIDEDVRELYNDAFFRQNLGIPLDKINDFIFYAYDNGLNEEMLEEGNELELMDFLIEQSEKYKKEISSN